jgi:hypothetical protein
MGGSTNAGGSSATGGTGGGTGGGPPSCADLVVEDDVATGETVAAEDHLAPSCGSGDSPELVFEWTAPYSEYFMFDSAGSDFDTVVSVLSDCDGPELACNNNRGTPQGLAVAKVTGGETYWIAVEGNNGETGEVNLAIAPVECPSADLTGQPLPATLSTVGGTTDHEARCTGQEISPQPEKTVRYVADSAGLYRFSASSSDFRVLLSLYDGAMCGGEYLQCSFGQVGSTAYPAEVTRYLEAGQAVTVVVEGENGEGTFELDIEPVDAVTGGCTQLTELGAGKSGVIDGGSTHELSSSCNWAGNANGFYSEHVYRFTVDQSSNDVSCYVTLESSSGPIDMYVIAGDDCASPEYECGIPNGYLGFSRSENGVYTLVIENTDSFQGSVEYEVTSTCD